MQMKHLRHGFLIVGIVIFWVLADRIGWATIGDQLLRLRWWITPILALSFCWTWTAMLGWRRALNRHSGRIGRWPLLRIKVAAETINTLTPVNFLGGDPFRIYLLKRYFPWTAGAASVVIDRTINSIAILATVLIGTTAAFWRIPHIPLNIRYGLPIVLTIASAFVAFLFAHQHRGLFGFLMHAARRLRMRRSFTRPTIERFEELDGLITDFYRRDRRGFWTVFAWHLIGRLLGIVEIYWIGQAVHPGFGFVEALVLGGVAPIINFCFTFIPGAVGVLEGTFTAVLYLMALPSAIGVTIQIIRRFRAALWIGLGFMALGTRAQRQLLTESAAGTKPLPLG
ncbi:MAG: flippase-like domain-containing protein [Deltaproteobacteria bacterium]|nr:flippase-like domain-containing protein [Deltaproteobacteria bacterium]